MFSILLPLALISDTQAGSLDAVFDDAADEFGVPAPLLKAMAWEASRGDHTVTSAWGGYGMFDFREPGEDGPDIEQVAALLDVSPNELMGDAEQQIRGAAALLAFYGESWGDGEAPPVDELEEWSTAVSVFWGREEPAMQNLYVGYIYDMVDGGFANARLLQIPTPVHYGAMPPPLAVGDYYGSYTFMNAHSSNYSDYSRSGSDINYLIIHTMQGSYSGSISWFQNSSANVSAHYCVRSSDGQITQTLLEEDVGWHAGNWTYNEESIGIEHEGYVDEPSTWYTDVMYEESAELSADIVSRTNVSADRSHIIAHSEVPGATHTDPGSGWDWDYYMGLIGGTTTGGSGARLLGVVADTDIYDKDARMSGVTISLSGDGSGSTTSDSTGIWSFEDLDAGTYTVTASKSGFIDGSCTSDITSGSGDWWCSIAMVPGDNTEPGDSGTGDGGTDDGGSIDTAPPEDTGSVDTDVPGGGGPGGPGSAGPGGEGPAGEQFGDRLLMSEEVKGCGCSAATGAGSRGVAWLLGLGGLAVLSRRRRRG